MPLFNPITSNINTTTVSTITTMPKGTKMKFSRNFDGGRRNESEHTLCMQVVKKVKQQYLRTVWCVKLKLTRLVVRHVELTKRKYLHPNANTSTHTTVTMITTSVSTTATKA